MPCSSQSLLKMLTCAPWSISYALLSNLTCFHRDPRIIRAGNGIAGFGPRTGRDRKAWINHAFRGIAAKTSHINSLCLPVNDVRVRLLIADACLRSYANDNKARKRPVIAPLSVMRSKQLSAMQPVIKAGRQAFHYEKPSKTRLSGHELRTKQLERWLKF